MSNFDKYFSNMQNKESRFYRRLQDLDDLIYDKYFNEFAGKTVFRAEVLSEVPAVDADGPGGNSTLYKPLRVRVEGIHTNTLPDPYEVIKKTPEDKQFNVFRTLLISHPLAYPDRLIYTDSAVSQPLTRGAIVEVRFIIEGPERSGRQRGIRYGNVIKPAPARSIALPPTLANVFDDFTSVFAVGDVSWVPKSTAVTIPDSLSSSLDSLMPYLSDTGFRGQITITSGERTFEAQVSAMMSNLFSGGTWIENTEEQQGAIEWIRGTYKRDDLTTTVGDLKINGANKTKTETDLKAFLRTETNGVEYWTTLTSHDTGNAADIKTRGLEYSEVALIEDGLKSAVGNNGPVKSFQWEKMTTETAREARKLNKEGVSGEHIHVTFVAGTGE